jgi:small conductance mechanosensitive channel
LFLLPALLLVLLASPLPAQDAPEAETASEEIKTTDLQILVRPLTADELKVEAEKWQAIVKARLEATGAAKIEGEATIDLERAQARAIDRYEIILGSWDAKGGDVKSHRLWLAEAANVELPRDASALWTMTTQWVKDPDGGIKWGINIVLFILTLIAFRILANVLASVTRRAVGALRNTSELLRNFFVNVAKKLTMLIGIVVALSMLEVNIGPFVAAIGAVGFVVAFALQGTLSNFASGIMILMYRPYDIGEFVKVAGVTGKVDAMSLVSTTIRTPDNQVVVVPNGTIWGDERTRRVDLVFGIGYGDDIAKAESVLKQILADHPKVLAEPAPVIMVNELANSSVNFVVRPWSLTSDYWDVYWDVTRQVKERFDAEGISIPFPQRDVHLHQVQSEA